MNYHPTLLVFLALCTSPNQADERPLGRLLRTPEQRLQLEQEARQGFRDNTEPAYVTGLVRRSRGPESRWINGLPAGESWNESASEILLQPAAGQPDRPLLQGGRILIRAGKRP